MELFSETGCSLYEKRKDGLHGKRGKKAGDMRSLFNFVDLYVMQDSLTEVIA